MSILHSRAENIDFNNQNDYYEVIGYLCTKNRILSIDAEVPTSLVSSFKSQYIGKCYTISNGITPSGLPSKFGAQFRINFLNVTNAPASILPYLKIGNIRNVVKRINKSRYVEELVLTHGFVFGPKQNVTKIKSLVPQLYLPDFIRGFNL